MNDKDKQEIIKEIEKLNNEINERRIEKEESEITKQENIRKIIVTSVIILLAGLGLGWLISEVIKIMYIAVGIDIVASIKPFTEIRKANDDINDIKERIKMCRKKIKQLKTDLENGLINERNTDIETEKNEQKNNFNYNHDKSDNNDEFIKYIDKLHDEGFFTYPDSESNNRKH